jgi:hypothetical protein
VSTQHAYPVVEVDQSAQPEGRGNDQAPVITRLRSLRPNGWEVALWAIAVVLVAGSIQLNLYATQHLYSTGMSSNPDEWIYLQSAVLLSPASLSAGLLSAIIAVAVRAFGSAATSRATIDAEAAAAAGTADVLNTAAAAGAAAGAAAASAYAPVATTTTPPMSPYPSVPEAAATTGTVSPASFARPGSAPASGIDRSLFERPRGSSGS